VSPCPRCGTDLEPWLALMHRAWRHREAARRALLTGQAALACREALLGWRLQHSERGRRLLILCLLASGQASAARALL